MSIRPRELYYIQDTRVVVGNSAMWWRENRAGYTCMLDEAMVVTGAQAETMGLRATDVPRLKSFVDERAQRHFDVQGLADYEG